MRMRAARRRRVTTSPARPVTALTVAASLLLALPLPTASADTRTCLPALHDVASFVTPEDGSPVGTTVPAGADLVWDLVVHDTCGTVLSDYTGTLDVYTSQQSGGIVDGPVVELTPADGGVAEVRIPVPRAGVTYVNVVEQGGMILSSTRLLVHGIERHPLVDLVVDHLDGSTRTFAGHAVDPDHAGAVELSVVVDQTVVARFPADEPGTRWIGWNDVLEDDPTAFSWRGTIPGGRHVVCLYARDVDGRGTTTQVPVTCSEVDLPPSQVPLAGRTGALDGVFRTPGGYRPAGWAIDPTTPGGTATLSVGISVPHYSTTVRRFGPTVVADMFRADVAAAFPGWGADHGFVADGWSPPAGQLTRLCVGYDESWSLGCATFTPRYHPVGSLEAVTGTHGGAVVRGWALDEDTYDPIDVHVYVDGRPSAVLRAGGARPDVAAAFPPAAGGRVPGYGPDHGYEATVAMPAGRHRVCAYGIDVKTYVGAPSTLLGCRDVDVQASVPRDPTGNLDGTTLRPGGVAVTGWAADPDAPSTALQVHTYVDGRPAGVTTADARRADLAVLGGSYGTAHGYTTTVATGPRSRVCSYAINVGAGTQNTTLGCRDVSRPVDPLGALDAVTRSGSQVQVRGWALDPDTDAVLAVHVYVDGRFAGALTADGSRADVAAGFPGWSATRGYTGAVSAAPGARVCVYALNAGFGSTNTTLGCRTA